MCIENHTLSWPCADEVENGTSVDWWRRGDAVVIRARATTRVGVVPEGGATGRRSPAVSLDPWAERFRQRLVPGLARNGGVEDLVPDPPRLPPVALAFSHMVPTAARRPATVVSRAVTIGGRTGVADALPDPMPAFPVRPSHHISDHRTSLSAESTAPSLSSVGSESSLTAPSLSRAQP